jgi:PAS domain S-box-containing protein
MSRPSPAERSRSRPSASSTAMPDVGGPDGAAGVVASADERLAAFVEAMPDGVVVTDTSGTIRLLNRRAEDLFGWSRADLVGHPVEHLLPPDARTEHIRHRADFAAAPSTRPMGAGLELQGLRRDGSEFPVEISLSPMPTADSMLVVAAVRDVTERRAVEERALVAERELAQLEDRERIARELHDTVIQRLFATGMALQSMVSQVPPDQAPRLEQAVDDLDETIREVRTAIFGLRSHLDWAGGRPLAPRIDADVVPIDQHGADLEGQEDPS